MDKDQDFEDWLDAHPALADFACGEPEEEDGEADPETAWWAVPVAGQVPDRGPGCTAVCVDYADGECICGVQWMHRAIGEA